MFRYLREMVPLIRASLMVFAALCESNILVAKSGSRILYVIGEFYLPWHFVWKLRFAALL
jgi:hypothetical protein